MYGCDIIMSHFILCCPIMPDMITQPDEKALSNHTDQMCKYDFMCKYNFTEMLDEKLLNWNSQKLYHMGGVQHHKSVAIWKCSVFNNKTFIWNILQKYLSLEI